MIDMTVARRYAKALLTLGKEDAHYKEYGEGLSGFAHLLEREPELKDALLNPIHGREDRAAPDVQVGQGRAHPSQLPRS